MNSKLIECSEIDTPDDLNRAQQIWSKYLS